MKLNLLSLLVWLAFTKDCIAFTASSTLQGRKIWGRHVTTRRGEILKPISTLKSRLSTCAKHKEKSNSVHSANQSIIPLISRDYYILPQHSKWILSSTISSLNESGSGVEEKDETLRDKLRTKTGFSFTAFRAVARATTGISLTALRTTLRGLTGVSISGTMKVITGVFPLWARFFLQPFLMLYYTPLLILRSLVGSKKGVKAEAKASHEHITDGWRNAIRAAEEAQEGGYWPVHVNDKGNIVMALPPEPSASEDVDVTEGVAKSVEFVMENRKESDSE